MKTPRPSRDPHSPDHHRSGDTPPAPANENIPQPRIALTTAEAAARLGLSPRTLEGFRIRGGGPPYAKLTQGLVRYRPADLDTWLEARIVANTAQGSAARET